MLPLAAFAKSGGGHAASGHAGAQGQAASHSQSSTTGSAKTSHGGGGMHNRLDPRDVPPLAGDRKVHVQDCTQPIDWSAGNLKCK